MTHRQAFYDPFASVNLDEFNPQLLISPPLPHPASKHATLSDSESAGIMMASNQFPLALNPLPIPLIIGDPSPDIIKGDHKSRLGGSSIQLPIKGQGVIALRVPPGGEGLEISVSNDSSGVDSPTTLYLILGKDSCSLAYGNPTKKIPIEWKRLKPEQASYFQGGSIGETYWLSVDRPNGWIRWGRGYTNVALATGEVELKYKDEVGVMVWKDKKEFGWLDTVQDVSFNLFGGNNVRIFSY